MCDASLGRAFIELGGDEYPRNTRVTLSLPFVDARGSELLQLRAVVVRADDAGVGVMLLEHGEAATRLLRRWIDASQRIRSRGQTAQVIPFRVRPWARHAADSAGRTNGATPAAGTEASN